MEQKPPPAGARKWSKMNLTSVFPLFLRKSTGEEGKLPARLFRGESRAARSRCHLAGTGLRPAPGSPGPGTSPGNAVGRRQLSTRGGKGRGPDSLGFAQPLGGEMGSGPDPIPGQLEQSGGVRGHQADPQGKPGREKCKEKSDFGAVLKAFVPLRKQTTALGKGTSFPRPSLFSA